MTGRPRASATSQNVVAVADIITAPATVGSVPPVRVEPTPVRRSPARRAESTIQTE
jgi:hypothetical protein